MEGRCGEGNGRGERGTRSSEPENWPQAKLQSRRQSDLGEYSKKNLGNIPKAYFR